jgi:hypothetical protein
MVGLKMILQPYIGKMREIVLTANMDFYQRDKLRVEPTATAILQHCGFKGQQESI